ncbi:MULTISPECIES: type I-B CRISPR-associated protein Cas5b [unclassified Methanoculleus]|uniref:type I-B CRISPR-associated protein Cas5b n=1 Tax=unclassified Methanoculleus TaxID=2619537 RepID=UPI0025EA7845|nr:MULTISPECIES: type I-B CRISPR-associated protein Cas5b [unclassified Methanoculleus]
MEVLRATIRAMTASFRYPMFMVGYQPTYRVPPISTVYGLLSAAKGEKVHLHDLRIGYDFVAEGAGLDLERIRIYGNETKVIPTLFRGTDIVNREFLYNCTLTLYLTDMAFEDYLTRPRYNLLLGRQSDLAWVEAVDTVTLIEQENVEIRNTIVPFTGDIPGQVVSLPSDFTDEAERRPLKVMPYCIVDSPQTISFGYLDPERNLGVHLHEFSN